MNLIANVRHITILHQLGGVSTDTASFCWRSATAAAALNMGDWDDDMPPPLSSLPDQLHAVTLSNSIIGTAALNDGELRVAATTHAGVKTVKAATSIKRGFLDSKPQKQQTGAGGKQRLPLIKARPPEQQQSKQIPAMFKLEPSEDKKRYNIMKSQLVEALAPTPGTIAAVGSDPTLAAGFDDPEVMRAVSEVAKDPSAIKRYANNQKVQQFYMAFGCLMGSKLESVSKQRTTQDSRQHGSGQSSTQAFSRQVLP